jgi:hypothetical protein
MVPLGEGCIRAWLAEPRARAGSKYGLFTTGNIVRHFASPLGIRHPLLHGVPRLPLPPIMGCMHCEWYKPTDSQSIMDHNIHQFAETRIDMQAASPPLRGL